MRLQALEKTFRAFESTVLGRLEHIERSLGQLQHSVAHASQQQQQAAVAVDMAGPAPSHPVSQLSLLELNALISSSGARVPELVCCGLFLYIFIYIFF